MLFQEVNERTKGDVRATLSNIYDLLKMIFLGDSNVFIRTNSDSEYKIIRTNKENKFPVECHSIGFIYVPDGEYKIRFGENGDWINSVEIFRGDSYDIIVDDYIEIKGELQDNLVLYLGK